MASPLYDQFKPTSGNNNMMKQLMDFKKNFTGNPQQIIQNMLNSGRISQTQINQYAQQANQIYQQFKGLI